MCAFCGSTHNLGVPHLDGDESDNDPRNLAWACKSCNGVIAAAMIRAGVGRRTRQYNPVDAGAASLGECVSALRILRGEIAGDFNKARQTIHNTPAAAERVCTGHLVPPPPTTDKWGVPF